MNVQVEDNGDVMIVKLQGNLDDEACDSLRATLSELSSESRTAVVIDMGGVRFISSQGLESLLWVRDYCHLSMVQLRLAGLDGTLHKILEMTRLLQEFSISEDVAEGLKSLA